MIKELVETVGLLNTRYGMDILVEYEGGAWYVLDDEICWGDLNDPVVARMTSTVTDIEGYVVVNVDTETGTHMTMIFDQDKEVVVEDFVE